MRKLNGMDDPGLRLFDPPLSFGVALEEDAEAVEELASLLPEDV